jgi:hypothetical protein
MRKTTPEVGINGKKSRLGLSGVGGNSSSGSSSSSNNNGSIMSPSGYGASFSDSPSYGNSFSSVNSNSAIRRPEAVASYNGSSSSSGSSGSSSNSNYVSAGSESVATDRNTFSAASNKASVFGGSAGAFNPSLFTTRASIGPGAVSSSSGGIGDTHDEEDGVFVDRTHQERLIEQMLKPVDEATVMQELIEERSVEIQKVLRLVIAPLQL